MLPLLLALLTPALASDIVVTLDRPVMVYVDSTRLPMDVGSLSAEARGLGSGTHLVEIRNMVDRPVTGLTVTLGEDEELRLRYQSKALTELGRGGLPPAQSTPAPAPAQPAATAQPAAPPSPEELAAGFGLTTTAATTGTTTTETTSVSATAGGTGVSLSVSVTEGAAAPAAANPTLSSASFTGPDPVMFAITLDGRTVPFIASTGSFVAPDLAPGKHAFLMTMNGAEALRADFTTEAGVHSACTILVQPFGYDTSCAPGGPPVTAASLQSGGTAGAAMNVNIFTGGAVAAPSAAAGPQPISESGLVALIAAVEDATFGSDQVSVLQTAAARNHFTCAQVVRLLEPLSHSSDKVEAVTALRGAIVDPQNAHVLEQAFTFSSDKEEVRALFR